jgi:cardiolipin synthase
LTCFRFRSFPPRPGQAPPAAISTIVLLVTVVLLTSCGSASQPDGGRTGSNPAAAGPSTSGPGMTAVPASAGLTLAVEPEDQYNSVDQLMAGARRSIDMTMYELADPQSEALLVAAHRRGVAVRVLLDRDNSGATVNRAAYLLLEQAGVSVRWAPDGIIFHQKTVTVDHSVSAIMTGNLTAKYYPTTRDFVLVDDQAAAVSAIEDEFGDDWGGGPVTDGPSLSGLVWSPESQSTLVNFIGSARRTVVVENEEMDSGAIESALEAAARRGVAVEVVMTANSEWDAAFDQLSAAGVRVATYPDSEEALYIHAKAVVVDVDRAFVGSQNFSTPSLQYNRELGVTTDDPAVVAPLAQTLSADFAGGTPFRPSP